jgi:AcrR family transcriptional regulator
VSTMAIYTYFDGMPGLWGAVRQEGFDRLRDGLAEVRPRRDPVQQLAALGVVYVETALAAPALYRVMFDSTFDLPDPQGAAATFGQLVTGVERAQRAGRFAVEVEARDVATRFWAAGHGLTSLAVGGVLPVEELARHAPATATAIFTEAGDQPELARRSVAAAWRHTTLAL